MWIDIFTLFPAMFFGPLQESMLKRAQQLGYINIILHQLRDYAFDRHQMTDDIPYGGGEGMLMKPEPLFRAVESTINNAPIPVILLTPQGRTFNQKKAASLAEYKRIALICGHYEGIDERVRERLVTEELSIGDYVLTGGELAAMVIIDAVARYIPGVLGAEDAAKNDSFTSGSLESPQYTRPADYRGWEVPEVLRSGNHAEIAKWRAEKARQRTEERRPDLINNPERNG